MFITKFGAALREPSYKKQAGAQLSHSHCCLVVYGWSPKSLFLFGSQEAVEAIFSQMASGKSFRSNTCKSMLWLFYVREMYS